MHKIIFYLVLILLVADSDFEGKQNYHRSGYTKFVQRMSRMYKFDYRVLSISIVLSPTSKKRSIIVIIDVGRIPGHRLLCSPHRKCVSVLTMRN